MDRATAKTMDCFVEFFSSGDAQAVVNKHRRTCDDGRHPRLGDRYVEMEMSTQDALMKELFPKAKNVSWPGGDPKIVRNDEPYNSGFKSFITGEELVMMVKHAEQPHRVSLCVALLLCLDHASLSIALWFIVTHYYALSTCFRGFCDVYFVCIVYGSIWLSKSDCDLASSAVHRQYIECPLPLYSPVPTPST